MKILNFIVLGIFFILTFSCSKQGQNTNHLDKINNDDFLNIYIELKSMELHLKKIHTDMKVYNAELKVASDSIFSKYEVTDSAFYESYKALMHNPDDFFLLFETTLDTLNSRINRIQE